MPDAETSPLPLMSPPQRPASRASRCSGQREGRMPDLRFVVFAARRKPPPTSWSRAARAGGRRSSEAGKRRRIQSLADAVIGPCSIRAMSSASSR